MLQVSRECSTGLATSLTLANRFLIRGTLFVVRKTRSAPVISITLCTGYSDSGENTPRACHTIATRLLTAVGGIIRARFVTCITYLLFRHRARYIHDHVIVLFNIIVEQINFLGGIDLPFEQNVFTCQNLIDGYSILPKMFLEFD